MSPDNNTSANSALSLDIRESYPLIDDSFLSNQQWTYVWGGLAIVFTLCLFLAFYTWMKRPREETKRSPLERAQAALLEAESLLNEKQLKSFSQKVSLALRQYIQDAYRIPVLELTTEEFSHMLKHRPQLSEAETARITDILNICDTLKFSPQSVPQEQITKILEEAKAFISSESAEEAEFKQS